MRHTITQSLIFVVLLAASAGLRMSPAHSALERPARGDSGLGTVPVPPKLVRTLVLTITPGLVLWPPKRIAVLDCATVGGTHPRPREACAVLNAVQGDLDKLRPPRDTVCTEDYSPLVVWSAGSWNGRNVATVRRFPNTCWMLVTLGPVGAF